MEALLRHCFLWVMRRGQAGAALALGASLAGLAPAPARAQAGMAPAAGPPELVLALRQWCAADSAQGAAGCPEPVAAFYAQSGYAPAWTGTDGATDRARAGVQLLGEAPRYGLRPADYGVARLQALLDSLGPAGASAAARVRAEVQLTAALLRFVRHLGRGRLDGPGLRPASTVAQPGPDAVARLRRALGGGPLAEGLLGAQPTSRSYVRLAWAWQRLLAADTAAAARVALPVALSLERLRWEPRADSVALVVNIPAFSLEVVRGPRVVASHRVVVGQAATPTPELYSRVTFFQAAPEWRVPGSIATREMLPRLRRDPGALAGKGFRMYGADGQRVNPYRVAWAQLRPHEFPYQIRQAPSAGNALGNVVFRFANPYEVYLHDTPTRAVFRAPSRALSHGCIRVEHPLDLARFLLRRDDAARAEGRVQDLQNSLDRGETTAFPLRAPVLLLVRYLTCDADGPQLCQRPDVYGRDAALARAWQEVPATPASVLALR